MLSDSASAGHVAGCVLGALMLYAAGRVLYNLHAHPLRHFPGPVVHRATMLARIYKLLRGTRHRDVKLLHDRYGAVVRVAPDELAFVDPAAWKDIYGPVKGNARGAVEMAKYSKFYKTPGFPPSLFGEPLQQHRLLRQQLAPGFSDRAVHDQVPVMNRLVDLLIRQLRAHCADDQGRRAALDVKTWYNYATFDFIGELVFGESFGCLDDAEYHPWVRIILGALKMRILLQALNYLGLLTPIKPLVTSGLGSHGKHFRLSEEKMRRRMAMGTEQQDLMDGLLKKSKRELTMNELLGNAGMLIVAGSETTASLLTGATYLLLSNPDALGRLTDEIQSAFASEEEITPQAVGGLPWMAACVEEALRRYPPVPFGLPRVVPEGGATIAGHLVPAGTVVTCWHYAMYHSESNWSDPYSFRPERFLKGAADGRDRIESLQPFSAGPRGCIGRTLAYAETRLILARILFNFDLALVDGDSSSWIEQRSFGVWDKPELRVYVTPVR